MGVVDPVPTRSTAERVISRVAVGVVVLVVVAGGSAFWNPWRLVVVERALFVPAVAIVTVIVFGCAFAALPVPAGSSRPFTPGRRALALVGVPVLSLQMWSLAVPGWPAERPRELARSPDGQRVVVLHRSGADTRCLSVWAGRGPGARVAGTLGNAGDGPVVTFEGRDLVVVRVARPSGSAADPRTSTRTFEVRLAPATGRPLDALPEPC